MTPTAIAGAGLAPWDPTPCLRLAWFVYGWIEREHMLNVAACTQWWLRALAASSVPFGPAASASPDRQGRDP